MAHTDQTATIGPFTLRIQADGLFTANGVAQRILNMEQSEEYTLVPVVGPTAWAPVAVARSTPEAPEVGDVPISRGAPVGEADITGFSPTEPIYGFRQHGVFHAFLASGREVLLLHTGDELWEFRGWARDWRKLISDPGTIHGTTASLRDDGLAEFPTQFTFTGNGVVIVPKGGRAYFYDGAHIAPLGFSQAPASPYGQGPESSADTFAPFIGGVNDIGYAHTSSHEQATVDGAEPFPLLGVRGSDSPMTEGFGDCRVGDIEVLRTSDPADVELAATGWGENGEWRAAVQFKDQWGNLSPVSPPSNSVTVKVVPAVVNIPPTSADILSAPLGVSKNVLPSVTRGQISWEVPLGPPHCTGRDVFRTYNTRATGDSTLRRMSLNALSVPETATLEDNVVESVPDNIPDGWLGEPAKRYLKVPEFKLSVMALGRHWIGNIAGAPSTLRPAEIGRPGTFLAGRDLTPDPSSELTALIAVDTGLLACTASSTFLVVASDDGVRERYHPVSSRNGCVAPNSAVSLPDGRTVFLGADGFYTYGPDGLTYSSVELRRTLKRLSVHRLRQAVAVYHERSRSYRCWVSLDSEDRNTHCFVYGEEVGGEWGWRERDDVVVDSVCAVGDETVIGGYPSGLPLNGGVYLLDHDATPSLAHLTQERESMVETAWLEAGTSEQAKTAYVVYLWLRETEATELTVEVLRNWRNDVVEAAVVDRYPTDDPPEFWGTTPVGTGVWRDARPYWVRAAIHVPSADTVKIRIRGRGLWEFIGVQAKLAPRAFGGAQLPP